MSIYNVSLYIYLQIAMRLRFIPKSEHECLYGELRRHMFAAFGTWPIAMIFLKKQLSRRDCISLHLLTRAASEQKTPIFHAIVKYDLSTNRRNEASMSHFIVAFKLKVIRAVC